MSIIVNMLFKSTLTKLHFKQAPTKPSNDKQNAYFTAFVNSLLDGKCSPEVMPILFGVHAALEKESGGIRLIAIGNTCRRIPAKCANSYEPIFTQFSMVSALQVEAGMQST